MSRVPFSMGTALGAIPAPWSDGVPSANAWTQNHPGSTAMLNPSGGYPQPLRAELDPLMGNIIHRGEVPDTVTDVSLGDMVMFGTFREGDNIMIRTILPLVDWGSAIRSLSFNVTNYPVLPVRQIPETAPPRMTYYHKWRETTYFARYGIGQHMSIEYANKVPGDQRNNVQQIINSCQEQLNEMAIRGLLRAEETQRFRMEQMGNIEYETVREKIEREAKDWCAVMKSNLGGNGYIAYVERKIAEVRKNGGFVTWGIFPRRLNQVVLSIPERTQFWLGGQKAVDDRDNPNRQLLPNEMQVHFTNLIPERSGFEMTTMQTISQIGQFFTSKEVKEMRRSDQVYLKNYNNTSRGVTIFDQEVDAHVTIDVDTMLRESNIWDSLGRLRSIRGDKPDASGNESDFLCVGVRDQFPLDKHSWEAVLNVPKSAMSFEREFPTTDYHPAKHHARDAVAPLQILGQLAEADFYYKDCVESGQMLKHRADESGCDENCSVSKSIAKGLNLYARMCKGEVNPSFMHEATLNWISQTLSDSGAKLTPIVTNLNGTDFFYFYEPGTLSRVSFLSAIAEKVDFGFGTRKYATRAAVSGTCFPIPTGVGAILENSNIKTYLQAQKDASYTGFASYHGLRALSEATPKSESIDDRLKEDIATARNFVDALDSLAGSMTRLLPGCTVFSDQVSSDFPDRAIAEQVLNMTGYPVYVNLQNFGNYFKETPEGEPVPEAEVVPLEASGRQKVSQSGIGSRQDPSGRRTPESLSRSLLMNRVGAAKVNIDSLDARRISDHFLGSEKLEYANLLGEYASEMKENLGFEGYSESVAKGKISRIGRLIDALIGTSAGAGEKAAQMARGLRGFGLSEEFIGALSSGYRAFVEAAGGQSISTGTLISRQLSKLVAVPEKFNVSDASTVSDTRTPNIAHYNPLWNAVGPGSPSSLPVGFALDLPCINYESISTFGPVRLSVTRILPNLLGLMSDILNDIWNGRGTPDSKSFEGWNQILSAILLTLSFTDALWGSEVGYISPSKPARVRWAAEATERGVGKMETTMTPTLEEQFQLFASRMSILAAELGVAKRAVSEEGLVSYTFIGGKHHIGRDEDFPSKQGAFGGDDDDSDYYDEDGGTEGSIGNVGYGALPTEPSVDFPMAYPDGILASWVDMGRIVLGYLKKLQSVLLKSPIIEASDRVKGLGQLLDQWSQELESAINSQRSGSGLPIIEPPGSDDEGNSWSFVTASGRRGEFGPDVKTRDQAEAKLRAMTFLEFVDRLDAYESGRKEGNRGGGTGTGRIFGSVFGGSDAAGDTAGISLPEKWVKTPLIIPSDQLKSFVTKVASTSVWSNIFRLGDPVTENVMSPAETQRAIRTSEDNRRAFKQFSDRTAARPGSDIFAWTKVFDLDVTARLNNTFFSHGRREAEEPLVTNAVPGIRVRFDLIKSMSLKNRIENTSGLCSEPLDRACCALWCFTPFSLRTMHSFAHHNVRLPMNFLVMRPHMNYLMDLGILCAAGIGNLGFCAISSTNYLDGYQVGTKEWMSYLNYWAAAIVTRPGNITTIFNLLPVRMCKGGGTGWMDPETYSPGVLTDLLSETPKNTPSLICAAIPFTEDTSKHNFLVLADRFEIGSVDASASKARGSVVDTSRLKADMQPVFSTFTRYDRIWGFSDSDDDVHRYNQNAHWINKYMFKGTTLYHTSASDGTCKLTHWTRGTGHWEDYDIPGLGKLISDPGLMPKPSYATNSDIMAVA